MRIALYSQCPRSAFVYIVIYWITATR